MNIKNVEKLRFVKRFVKRFVFKINLTKKADFNTLTFKNVSENVLVWNLIF